jgi:prepilin-type N-terminal cleavage/methylation domain-containing protein
MKKDHTNTALSNKNRGFSLIEALIAMAIFSIGILAVGSMQLSTTKNNTTGNITTQATMLARQKIEELKAVQDLVDIVPDSDIVGIYSRKWDGGPISGITRPIWVEVSWPPRRGQDPRTIRLDTITIGN